MPICGNLKFEDQNGFYRHLPRLAKCNMKIYSMVERFLGEHSSCDTPAGNDVNVTNNQCANGVNTDACICNPIDASATGNNLLNCTERGAR